MLLLQPYASHVLSRYHHGTTCVFRCVLRMRQAKLSFPLVHLMVGVFSDAQCEKHGEPAQIPHIERCELVSVRRSTRSHGRHAQSSIFSALGEPFHSLLACSRRR